VTRAEIIKRVKGIILKHTKPVRIWLYGSEASGEASQNADIDIAFEDPAFHDLEKIRFTYEMSWKVLKRYLDFVGIGAQNPRSCFREAYQQGLLAEESVWLEMIEQRNLSAHEYNEQEIARLIEKAGRFLEAFKDLYKKLETKHQEMRS